jgi:Flp pilus assembly protein TadG
MRSPQLNLCRRGRTRGSAILEMGLVMVTYLALVFAIVDYGLVIFVKATLQHAVREGVRYAITYQTGTGMKHDASIKAVVQGNSMGFLKGSAGLAKIHIRYFNPANPSVEDPNNDPGSIIQVSVEDYSWNFIAPIWRSKTPMKFFVLSADRMESLPSGMTAPPARS